MTATWQDELRRAVSSVRELAGQDYAFLEAHPGAEAAESRFRTLVPPYYLGLIRKEDPADPVAKIAFPTAAELDPPRAGRRDPIGDLVKKAAPRLTHRYADRALLHVTNLCPMYCRFCFRKNLMNERDEDLYRGDFEEAFVYLGAHPEIEEVILTGGDPWMLADDKLRRLVDDIAARAPSVKRLRFHTRMPVTLPMRVTDALIDAILRPGRFQTIVVTHFNHPHEVSELAREGLRRLRRAGVLTLNQGVLLKGVNDEASVLRRLYLALGEEGVLPYYLHHCDLVEGGEHFRTSVEEGRAIWTELRGTLPGYFIPEYILDTPGGGGKIPLGGNFVKEKAAGEYELVRGGLSYSDPR